MNLQGHCRLRSRKLSQSVNNSINKICELYISSDLIIYLSAGDHTKLYKYVEESLDWDLHLLVPQTYKLELKKCSLNPVY
jgi:hypothetical protein